MDKLLRVLDALAKDPVASFNKLSKKVGLSPSTIRRMYHRLVGEGFISAVYALVDYSAIEREVAAVFIAASPKTWSSLELALDEHFYLRSRARCIGAISGVHAFFAIPSGTIPYLREFLDGLRELGLLDSYRVITPASRWLYVEPDLLRLSSPQPVDWTKAREYALSAPPLDFGSPTPSMMARLTVADLKILDRLTVNARMKKGKLAEFAGLKPYELSRRLRFLRERGVILGYRVALGPRLLERFTNMVVIARCGSRSTRLLASLVKKLPYQSTFIPTDEGFLLYTLVPSSDFTLLYQLICDFCDDVAVSWMDYRHSRMWNLAYEAYREDRRAWDSSYEFMVEKPLASVRKMSKSAGEFQAIARNP